MRTYKITARRLSLAYRVEFYKIILLGTLSALGAGVAPLVLAGAASSAKGTDCPSMVFWVHGVSPKDAKGTVCPDAVRSPTTRTLSLCLGGSGFTSASLQ